MAQGYVRDLKVTRMLYERVEKQEELIVKIEASVFQVANYNFVFQGVILAAIVQGQKCRNYWLPLSISALGGLINLCSLLLIAVKYSEGFNELDRRGTILYKHLYPAPDNSPPINYKRKKKLRMLTLVLYMILFFIFILLNLLAAKMIPC